MAPDRKPRRSNEAHYAGGLLTRALDPATQPLAIRRFLEAENDFIRRSVADGARVIDLGCGTGRHLALVRDRLAIGVGVDYQAAYIAHAIRRHGRPPLYFVVADAARVPIRHTFDLALCMTNTWGTMADKPTVLREMRRLAPRPRSRRLCVYSETSIPARREWYQRLGHPVVEITDTFVRTATGFRSEHFSPSRIQELVRHCEILPLARVGYVVQV